MPPALRGPYFYRVQRPKPARLAVRLYFISTCAQSCTARGRDNHLSGILGMRVITAQPIVFTLRNTAYSLCRTNQIHAMCPSGAPKRVDSPAVRKNCQLKCIRHEDDVDFFIVLREGSAECSLRNPNWQPLPLTGEASHALCSELPPPCRSQGLTDLVSK